MLRWCSNEAVLFRTQLRELLTVAPVWITLLSYPFNFLLHLQASNPSTHLAMHAMVVWWVRVSDLTVQSLDPEPGVILQASLCCTNLRT
jgi:hypothetical protein